MMHLKQPKALYEKKELALQNNAFYKQYAFKKKRLNCDSYTALTVTLTPAG